MATENTNELPSGARSLQDVARPLTKSADAYVGRKECGCLVAVVFDDPRFKKDTAKTVGEFIKSGYRVEHVVWDEVKGSLGRCKCPKERPSKHL